MIRRMFVWMLCVVVCLTFLGCGSEGAKTPASPTVITTETTVESTEAPTTEPETVPATEAATEPATEPATEAATEPTTAPETDAERYSRYGSYIGAWQSTTENNFLTMYLESGIMYLEYSCLSGNGNRIAEAIASVAFEDIQNDLATFYYSDDGWGNSGTIVLDFSQPDRLGCTTTVTQAAADAFWGINAGTFVFVPQT